MTIEHQLVIAP